MESNISPLQGIAEVLVVVGRRLGLLEDGDPLNGLPYTCGALPQFVNSAHCLGHLCKMIVRGENEISATPLWVEVGQLQVMCGFGCDRIVCRSAS